MRKITFLLFLLLTFACSKEEELLEAVTEDDSTEVPHTDPDGSDSDNNSDEPGFIPGDTPEGENGSDNEEEGSEDGEGNEDSEGNEDGNSEDTDNESEEENDSDNESDDNEDDSDSENEDGDNPDHNENGEEDSSDNEEDEVTNSPPLAAVLIYPLNGTECTNSDLVVEWNESTDPDGDTISYNLIIDTSPNFNDTPTIYENISATNYTLDLPIATALYWKVESRDIEATVTSEIWSFYTQGEGIRNSVPQIENILPVNNASFENGQGIRVEWRGSDLETPSQQLRYNLYISELGQDLEIRLNNVSQTNFTFGDLNANTTYQWMVSVTDTDDATTFSEVFTFSID